MSRATEHAGPPPQVRYDTVHGNQVKPRARILVVLSALFFVATVGAWTRSYREPDALERRDLVANDTNRPASRNVGQLERRQAIISSRGGITWAEARYVPVSVSSRSYGRWFFTDAGTIHVIESARQVTLLRRLGFVFHKLEPAIPPAARPTWAPRSAITIPYWLPALFFAAAPAFHLLRRARGWLRTRSWLHHTGLCRHCGYDLRASQERCPECGHAIPDSVETSSSHGRND